MALALVIMAAVGATPAHALNGYQQAAELVGKGGYQPPGFNCGTVCSDVWLEEHRPMPNQTSSNQLHRELARLRQRTGVMPSFSSLATRAVPAAGAFLIGWEIGTELNKIFFEKELTNVGAGTVVYQPFQTLVSSSYADVAGPGFVLGSPIAGARPAVFVGTSTACFEGQQASASALSAAANFRQDPDDGPFETESGDCEPGEAIRYQYVHLVQPDAGATEVTSPFTTSQPDGFVATDTTPTWSGKPGSQDTLEDRVQTELESNPQDYAVLLPWLEHWIDGEGENPIEYPVVALPDCTGLSYNACITALQDAGFGVHHRNTRTFEEAVPLPQGQPDEVFGTTPAAGQNVATDTDIAIDANPADEALPRIVPEPAARETAAEYEARALVPLGLTLGTPDVLPEEQIDPTRGPDEVVSTQPQPGARVAPDAQIAPRVNPTTAPEPLPDAWTAPDIRAIDLAPLAAIGTPCNVFPFGVFCWLHGALGGWGSDAACPSFTVPFSSGELEFDGCLFNPAMDIIRPIVGIVSLICLVYMVAASALGFGGRGADD